MEPQQTAGVSSTRGQRDPACLGKEPRQPPGATCLAPRNTPLCKRNFSKAMLRETLYYLDFTSLKLTESERGKCSNSASLFCQRHKCETVNNKTIQGKKVLCSHVPTYQKR